MNWPDNTCDPIWEHADWLPPGYILDRWCQQDARCRQAKQQALLSACERGELDYRRSDGKTFDDPVHELAGRGLLLIERDSFNAWATQIEGASPLASTPRPAPLPPRPAWADDSWRPPATPVASTRPPTITAPPVDVGQGADDEVADDVDAAADDAKPDYATYPPEAVMRERGVPADEIIVAFQVQPGRQDNIEWWRERMANTRRYKKLASALVQKGLPNRGGERYPSWWRPDLVARWLIDAKHLPVYRVAPILRKEFPVWAKLFDEQ